MVNGVEGRLRWVIVLRVSINPAAAAAPAPAMGEER